MADPRDPDATVREAGDVETVDALGARRRAERDGDLDPARRAAPLARLPATAATTAPPFTIGRYQLLGMVGSGGMGMVFGAWDPELERRVALKLLRSTSQVSRDRMLREGQILARLSHPNVVPVFDVGQVGDQVYLVMEYVHGTTLRDHAAQAPGQRGVLDAYRQAGEGLAAAHRAGVIHRDFKPANAIRGDDGRVRVLDFGIARTSEVGDRASDVAGTPAYMAPEQLEGAALSPAVDQYAFCVSLREALAASGDVPAWIAAILDRGTQPDPAHRYPTLDELLAELARDPARRWRRLGVASSLAIAATTAFVVGQSSSTRPTIEPCSGGAAEVARTWDAAARTRVLDHLRAVDSSPRGVTEGVRLARELDHDAGAWAGEHRAACLAHARGELSTARYDVRLSCLDRTRAHLAAVVDLVATIDPGGLDNVLLAARMRPDPRGCAAIADAIAPPPAGVAPRVAALVPPIERALVRAAAWREDAVPLAASAVTAARALGYPPLLARALLAHGRALMAARKREAADALDEALRVGLAASDDALAVEAYARWVFVRAVDAAPSTDNLGVIELLAARLGARGRFARALLYNNLGVARLIADDRAGAHAAFTRAATEAEGAPEIELAIIGQNLANLEPTPADSLRRIQATYDRYLATLGPAHAQTIMLRAIVGAMTPDRQRARALHGDCGGLDDQVRGDCLYEAAWLADEDGDLAAATRLMAAHPQPESASGRIARAYVATRAGTLTGDARRELAATADRPHATFYDRLYAADASIVLALGSTGTAADAWWRRANELAATVELAAYRRRLARTDAELARRLRATRPAQAAVFANRALTWYRGSASDPVLIAQLTAITAGLGSR